MPEIKAMLRICSRNLYGWTCDHEDLAETVATLDAWDAWDDFPVSWPRTLGETRPMGMVELTIEIERQVRDRRAGIKRDLESAGLHYPRDEVRQVLDYWSVKL